MLSIHGRTVTLMRPGTVLTGEVRISPSNYFRHLEAIEKIVSQGREFVLSKEHLDKLNFGRPKRGDKLIDPDLGTMTITEPREMYDLGGAIIGYRLRTD